MTAASNSEARKRLADPTPHTDPTAAAVRAAQAEALTNAERLAISAVVHQNYFMPDVFAAVEAMIRRRGLHAAFDRALLTRLQAVVAECDLAEAEARHVVDDEVYVSVGLIRYALHASTPADRLATDTAAPEGGMVVRLPLAAVLAGWRDGDEHGWDTEFRYLRSKDRGALDLIANTAITDGIREPIHLGGDGRVWDGHHRLCVADELALPDVPVLLPAAPVAVEGVETVETLAEVLAAHCIVGTERGQQGVTQVIPEDVVLCNTCGWLRASDYTTHLAPRVVQARAGEGALRERIEAVLAATPCVVIYADRTRTCGRCVLCQIRAALDPEATT